MPSLFRTTASRPSCGERSITADTALRLATYFGTSADVWMNLQMMYDLKKAEIELGAAIRSEIKRRVA